MATYIVQVFNQPRRIVIMKTCDEISVSLLTEYVREAAGVLGRGPIKVAELLKVERWHEVPLAW